MRGWNLSFGKLLSQPGRLANRISRSNNYLLFLITSLILAMSSPVMAKINVIATIKPVHSLIAGVMSGVGSPHLLIKSGSPHAQALKPSNAKALQNADLIFWIGPGLETFLISPLKSLATRAVIISLAETKWLTLHKVREDQQRGKKHDHRGNRARIDPHIWLDPQNARAFVIKIATVLSDKDPLHKDHYWTNAKKLISRLDELTKEIQSQLTPVRERPYLTFHDDFSYFERRFNLNHGGSIAINPDRQPGARHLMELRNRIKQKNIGCVFSEPQFRSKLVDLVVEGTGARTGVLDPLGAQIKKGPKLYFTLLRNNARAFISCLGG